MFCPVCKSEFREGFDRCAECQVNLVKDLNNISEKIDGEIALCVPCQIEFESNEQKCPECGVALVRAVLSDDKYVFLQEVGQEHKFFDPIESESLANDLQYHTTFEPDTAETLIESTDMKLLIEIQQLLNESGIYFQYLPPHKSPGALGSIFGETNPLNKSFPKILVSKDDEEKAVELLNNSQVLGLNEIPPELMEEDDDDESEQDDY